jgi:starvation-inducible DNA-binding protein
MKIDIGISEKDRKKIANGLSHFLADSYTLYLKTHNFHWNVTGPMFNSLHAMFMTQYTEEWTALDEIAERIRALGFNAPGSYAEFVKLSSIKEESGADGVPDWRGMVSQLVAGNEAVCRTARKVLKTADEAGDDPTVDLATQRLQVHEKYAWMLRSLLE